MNKRTPAAGVPLAVLLMAFPALAFAQDAGGRSRTGNLCTVYAAVFAVSVLVLVLYLAFARHKTHWHTVLFGSVAIANCGYFVIAAADRLAIAVWGNRIAYFGAALLPLSMLMILLRELRVPRHRYIDPLLVGISALAYLLAASGGSSIKLYYESVEIAKAGGGTVLQKVYGPLHELYALYLLGYFGAMVAVMCWFFFKKKQGSLKYMGFLAAAVLGNIVVWAVEKLTHSEFEFLSLTYIVTELLLLLVHGLMREYELLLSSEIAGDSAKDQVGAGEIIDLLQEFLQKAQKLTATERSIIGYYAEGCDVAQVAEQAFISIHTVRKHNMNIYKKLDVSSREELVLYLELFRRSGRLQELLQPKK